MLASINPLGERARNRRWGVTASAYVAGSVLGAAAIGLAAGGVGAGLRALGFGSPWIAALAASGLCALGAAFDLGVGGLRLPTVHRQVDERWLDRYRGWVYGLGFGTQLGLGVVTAVNSAAVYAFIALAMLSASVPAGLAMGVAFGVTRALPVVAAGRSRRPSQLGRLHRVQSRLRRWDSFARRATAAVQAAGAVALMAVALANRGVSR